VLIRRGPKKWSCVFGWDRAADTFQPGQCVKGYLDATQATLSPCGRYFAYAVAVDRMTEKGYFETCIYSVVSRPPWLKALAFWNRYGVGLLREHDGSLQLDIQADQHGSILPDKVHDDWIGTGIHLNQLNPTTRPWGHLVYGAPIEFEKWRLEGWTAITPWEKCPEEECRGVASWWSPNDVHRIHFEKPIPGTGWKMRLSHWGGCHSDSQACKESYRGVRFETFSLHFSSGEVREFPDWISADHDTSRNRIVWTKGQQLWAMDVLGDDFGGPVLLLDVASEKGWRTPAPY
jgi:hypothetical protein